MSNRGAKRDKFDLLLQDEAAFKADFPSMGNGADIPRVFRTNGKVRNKNVTKRQTEMLVKEIWKVRMANRKAGKTGVDLVEMIFLHLQKTKGLLQAVIEASQSLPPGEDCAVETVFL